MPPKSKYSYLELASGICSEKIAAKRRLIEDLAIHRRDSFLAIEEEEIKDSLALFETYLPQVKLFFAMKANPEEKILRLIKDYGHSFDVASAGEIQMIADIGVDGAKMNLANPVKNLASLHALASHEIKAFTFDSCEEIEKISVFFQRLRRPCQSRPLLRFKTTSQHVQTDLSIKFGCEVADFVNIVKRSMNAGITPAGISFHVGTNSFAIENYSRGIATALELREKTRKETGVDLKILDIGGGFPVDPWLSEDPKARQDFFKKLAEVLAPLKDFQLWAEPGRCMVAPAGTIASRIIGKKSQGGKNWLFLSDGVYGCYSGILFDHGSFSFFPVDEKFYDPKHASELVPYTLAGPTCDSVDIVAEEVLLPKDIATGDWLFSPQAGAYSIVSATTFNGFQIAESIYIRKEEKIKLRLIA